MFTNGPADLASIQGGDMPKPLKVLLDASLLDTHQYKVRIEGKVFFLTQEPITRIISKQLDITLGPFTQEELDSVLRKINNRKAAGLDEIPAEVWKTRQFDDILLQHCNAKSDR